MIRVHGGADCIRVAQIPKRSPNLANHSVPTHRFRDTWSRGTSPPPLQEEASRVTYVRGRRLVKFQASIKVDALPRIQTRHEFNEVNKGCVYKVSGLG